MGGANGFDRLGVLGLAVFDVLCLIQHHGVKIPGAVGLGIAAQQTVAGDDQIVARNGGKMLLSAGTVQRQHPQFRRELCRLGGPVKNEGGGTDNEPGSPRAHPGGIPQGADQGEHLQGFTQPHFIRQNAAEMIAPEEA